RAVGADAAVLENLEHPLAGAASSQRVGAVRQPVLVEGTGQENGGDERKHRCGRRSEPRARSPHPTEQHAEKKPHRGEPGAGPGELPGREGEASHREPGEKHGGCAGAAENGEHHEPDRPGTPASSKVAISPARVQASSTRGNAASAPLPSPSRIPSSTTPAA